MTSNWISSHDIIDLVNRSTPEKPLFLVKMHPVRDYGIFRCTSSADPEYWVPCVVDQSNYKVADNYKVELRALSPSFPKESFYILDMAALMRSGKIKVLDQAAAVPAIELVTKPVVQQVKQSLRGKLKSFSVQLLSHFQ